MDKNRFNAIVNNLFRILFLCIGFSIFSQINEIELGGHTLAVEIADTPELRATGLMGRKHLAEGTGMLFIYDEPEILNFWMKNTLVPLSIGFFDADQKLIFTADMDPPKGPRMVSYSSRKKALYALEVPQGWFAKNQILIGEKFSFHDDSNRVK